MADDFAKEVRELYHQAVEADRENCEEALIDLDFEAGNQWNETIKRQREALGLPCPTINVAQQYTGLLVGDWLNNETAIRVLPKEDGTVKEAEVRSEIMRSIELHSNADRIYASCLGQTGACGISNFRIDIDNANDDAFVRDIFINDIPNPLAVKWDPLGFDPTGKDAKWNFVGDEIPSKEYERTYKDAARPALIQKEAGSDWCSNGTVIVPEYWRMVEKTRVIGMTVDGRTVDLTDLPKKKWPQLAVDSDTKEPIINEKAKCNYAVMVRTNGMEQLSDPYELRLPRLPIIRVMGREVWTRDGRVRFGLTRFMRDPILLRNHNVAIRAELLMKAPRVNFVANASSIEGREGDWENTLVYNDNAQPPVEVTSRNLGALLAEDRLYNQALMDVTGMHEASRGMPSNEKSGVAIQARQDEGDTATAIYHHNMTAAQQEAGEVINALIPIVYDTPRTLRTVGPDLGVKMVRVNDPNDPESIDLGVGKYGVVISTGPRYQTRRQQTVDAMMALIQAYPPLAQIIGDLVIKEQDIPGADKMAERVKRSMNPQILGDDADDGKSEEEIAQQQQKAQEAQQVQQMGMMLQMRSQQAETTLKEAQAMKAQAEAEKAQAEAMLAKAQAMEAMQGGDGEGVERNQIEAFNAVTNRIKAVASVTPDSPPSLADQLTPVIAQVVGDALKMHLGITAPPQTPDLGEAA